jgi:hypothetical protein
MTSKALRRRKASPHSANILRTESVASGNASTDRLAGYTPVTVTKGRLRKCGPIVLICLRICL